MALAFHRRRGAPARDRLVALVDGYHGDTAGAMSVSDDGPFVRDFGALRVPVARVGAPVRGRPLDLDHIGAQIRQGLRAPGAGEHTRQVENAHAGERGRWRSCLTVHAGIVVASATERPG